MASMGPSVQQQVNGFFGRLTGTQKMMLGVVALGAIAAIITLVTLVNAPSYAILFSNLSPEDASKIVTKLKDKDIQYRSGGWWQDDHGAETERV